MLDFRTLGYADDYLSDEEQLEGEAHLEAAYVTYALTAHNFRMRGATPSAVANLEAPGKRKRSVFVRESTMAMPKEGKSVENQLKKTFAREFKVAWLNWNQHCIDIDWCAFYKTQFLDKTNDALDIVEDLMPLDIGPLYSTLDPTMFFKLPNMAKQRLGENMAASFCERMNSIAKDVLDEGHSLLLDAELESIVVLRANRDFMKMCRYRLFAEMWGLPMAPL